eukprot:311873_1
MMSSTQIVERRNYTQLKWKSDYDTYQQNYNQNNNNNLSLICQCKNKKYSNKKCECSINWNWYLFKNNKTKDIPRLRGHSICDIGNNKLITIGNKTKNDTIDIYQIQKDFNNQPYKKLKSFGNVPKQRFAHSAEYIAPIHAILFYGGFDSKSNYNDARLLFLQNMTWINLIYNANIDFRAYHSTASRIIYDDTLKTHKYEMYLFGGQFCNGGPYEYHNDLFKFTFYDKQYSEINLLNAANNNEQNANNNVGWFQCDQIQTFGTKPRPRSQCYSWINDNKFHVFGGCYDTETLNDLWILDLHSLMWTEIKYNGMIQAPLTERIKPINFRIHPARKPCYFDTVLNKLIVIHYGYLSYIQNKYVKCRDNVAEFEQRKYKQKKRKNNPFMAATFIFMFDMISRKWDIIKLRQHDLKQIPPHIPLSTCIRIGQYMALIGGGCTKSQLVRMKNKNNSQMNVLTRNYMHYLYFLKLPLYRINNTISWSRERLIWIGHLKMNKWKKYINKNECFLYKVPKQMILLIISFLNITPKYDIINTQSNIKSMDLEMSMETKDENDEDELVIVNHKMQTLMGYEENNQLLRFNNNKYGELSPESVLIADMKLMDNPQDAPPVKFVFNKQIVGNINYVNDNNNNKKYKSSPMHQTLNVKLINNIGNDENKDDDNDTCLLKQGVTLMGYCDVSNTENVKEEDNSNTKGEVLLGYVQHTKK